MGEQSHCEKDLGGTRGDLALIRRRLISLAIVTNNTFHLCLTTFFDDAVIIPPEGLTHAPPGIRDIITLVGNAASAIYVHEPLPAGEACIDILLDNLWSNTIDPPSLTFEDIVVSWFSDLLLSSNQVTDKKRVDNLIFQAYGLTP